MIIVCLKQLWTTVILCAFNKFCPLLWMQLADEWNSSVCFPLVLSNLSITEFVAYAIHSKWKIFLYRHSCLHSQIAFIVTAQWHNGENFRWCHVGSHQLLYAATAGGQITSFGVGVCWSLLIVCLSFLDDASSNWTTVFVDDGQSKELAHATSPAFDAVVKILHCQAVVAITDQSDTPVSLDLFDVFQWRAGGGRAPRKLEPFSSLPGAHSVSLTAVIDTRPTVNRDRGTSCGDTAGVNYTGRWSTIAVACQVSNFLANFKCVGSSVQFPFLTFLLPFRTFSLPFHFHFYWRFRFR